MERTSSSREAVELMGALASKYGPLDVGCSGQVDGALSTPVDVRHACGRGFYGPPDSFEGSGESLVVGDPDEAGSGSLTAEQPLPQNQQRPGLGFPDPVRSHRHRRHLGGQALAGRPDDGGCRELARPHCSVVFSPTAATRGIR